VIFQLYSHAFLLGFHYCDVCAKGDNFLNWERRFLRDFIRELPILWIISYDFELLFKDFESPDLFD
jgi:hypothetical protein